MKVESADLLEMKECLDRWLDGLITNEETFNKIVSVAIPYLKADESDSCIENKSNYKEDMLKLGEIVDDAFCRVRDEIGRPLNCDELRAMFDRVIYQGLRHLEGYDGQ